MPSQTRNSQVCATCLTPPSAGGIAVIEVIGAGAAAVVNPLLVAKRPVDVATMSSAELRLCRIVDRGDVLDDAIVAARRLADGAGVVDISVHGGTRVVQRVLMALAAAGATIVEPRAFDRLTGSASNLLEAESVELLARAKTRAVAVWLARAPAALLEEARRIDAMIAAGRVEAGRSALNELAERFTETHYLLDGIRVVLTGAPNSGKSTLANALAGAEHSIVSPIAGTTRDWVELPAAIAGMPVTLVDTAGIAHTHDAIEQEAMHRAAEQLATADIVLRVVDRSATPMPDVSGRTDQPHPREIMVWNKCDLAPSPDAIPSEGQDSLRVSALTAAGLAELRQRILTTAGMTDWPRRSARLCTERQYRACLAALAMLQAGSIPVDLAHDLLEFDAQVVTIAEQDARGMV